MSYSGKFSLPTRIFLLAILNVALVAVLQKYAVQFFHVVGGFPAYIAIGALLTLMNMIIRPILAILTLPLKLFATLFTLILVNGGFLWLIVQIVNLMDDRIVRMEILGGLEGWIFLSLAFGFANWVMRVALK